MSDATDKPAPRILTDAASRDMARRTRDGQWDFMQQVADQGTIWLCWWNKNRHHDRESAPEDLVICGLIDGMELLGWMKSHKDWWVIGSWSDERYAAPVSLTPAGHEALASRALYDLEPVNGGLVEPGWTCVPAEREAA